jgi:hypothetical protein
MTNNVSVMWNEYFFIIGYINYYPYFCADISVVMTHSSLQDRRVQHNIENKDVNHEIKRSTLHSETKRHSNHLR